MALTAKLAELFIQFTSKGIDAVNKGVDAVHGKLDAIRQQAELVGGALESRFKVAADLMEKSLATKIARAAEIATGKLLDQAISLRGLTGAQAANFKQTVENAVALDRWATSLEGGRKQADAFALKTAAAFGIVSVPIAGFVRSGVAASAMGDVLNFQFQRLSLTVAGLFRPEIEKVAQAVQGVTLWLQGLTAQQKENIAGTLKFAAAFTFAAVAMPYVVSGIAAVVAGVKSLTLAALGLQTATGSLTPVFVGLSVVVAVIASQTDVLDWFGALQKVVEAISSPAGQLAISILTAASAFAATAYVIPRIVTGVYTLVSAIKSLNISLAVMNALSGPKGWAQLAVGVAAAAAAVGAVVGLQALTADKEGKDKGDKRGAMAGGMGGFMAVDEAYRRVAEQSVKVGGMGGKSPQERQVELGEQQLDEQKITNGLLRNQRPPVTRD